MATTKPMPKILNKAVPTNEVIAAFAKIVTAHTTKPAEEPAAVLATLKRIRSALPEAIEERQVAEFVKLRARKIQDLVDTYIRSIIGSKYPRIDPSLWERKRRLVLGDASGKVISDFTGPQTKPDPAASADDHLATVPLFATVFLDAIDQETMLYNDSKEWTEETGDSNRLGGVATRISRRTYRIDVVLPPVPDNILAAGHKALGWLHGRIAEMFGDPDLARVLKDRIPEPKLSISWIPLASSLKIEVTTQRRDTRTVRPKLVPTPEVDSRPIDPVLTLDVGDDRYVIAYYDIPEEKSSLDLLREFSEGSFDNVLRK